MAFNDNIIAYKAQYNEEIALQDTANSIPPDVVASLGLDLADIAAEEINAINALDIDSGTDEPAGGADKDLYYRTIANAIEVYRNVGGVWTLKTTIAIGIALPDGIITGLRTSIEGFLVTVTAGSWAIDNQLYAKATQTQLIVGARDVNFDRWDLIYATKTNTINILQGAATLVPVKPDLPADTTAIDYVYIPAIGDPYLLTGQSLSAANSATAFAMPAGVAFDSVYTFVWSPMMKTTFGNIRTIKVLLTAGGGMVDEVVPIKYIFNVDNTELIQIEITNGLNAGLILI